VLETEPNFFRICKLGLTSGKHQPTTTSSPGELPQQPRRKLNYVNVATQLPSPTLTPLSKHSQPTQIRGRGGDLPKTLKISSDSPQNSQSTSTRQPTMKQGEIIRPGLPVPALKWKGCRTLTSVSQFPSLQPRRFFVPASASET
jgi:hypothetical protein